jgi:hypothetical protein
MQSPTSAQSTNSELQLLDELYKEQLISTAIYERRRARLTILDNREVRTYRLPETTADTESVETSTADASKVERTQATYNGKRIALLIGNDNYQTLPILETAVSDTNAIAKMLSHNFGFSIVKLEDVTRDELLTALAHYRRELSEQDNFILYYAGHGIIDDVTQRGYWLPVDAESDNPSNWVSSIEVSDALFSMKAKHALVIADSCFSSSLLEQWVPGLSGESSQLHSRSRTLITSGGFEPVLDSGFGEHSVFASALLDALKEADKNTSIENLFERVRHEVVGRADQTPQYGLIKGAGHTGGEFPLR